MQHNTTTKAETEMNTDIRTKNMKKDQDHA